MKVAMWCWVEGWERASSFRPRKIQIHGTEQDPSRWLSLELSNEVADTSRSCSLSPPQSPVPFQQHAPPPGNIQFCNPMLLLFAKFINVANGCILGDPNGKYTVIQGWSQVQIKAKEIASSNPALKLMDAFFTKNELAAGCCTEVDGRGLF